MLIYDLSMSDFIGILYLNMNWKSLEFYLFKIQMFLAFPRSLYIGTDVQTLKNLKESQQKIWSTVIFTLGNLILKKYISVMGINAY